MGRLVRFVGAFNTCAFAHNECRAILQRGAAHAPRLLIAFSEQRERYPNPADLEQYSGIGTTASYWSTVR